MKILASISLVQLIGQLVAARKAIRDHVPYDIPFMRGKAENVARDMWTIGTGLSAPWPVLAAHAAGTVLLLARPRQGLQRAMGWLGSRLHPGRALGTHHPGVVPAPGQGDNMAVPRIEPPLQHMVDKHRFFPDAEGGRRRMVVTPSSF